MAHLRSNQFGTIDSVTVDEDEQLIKVTVFLDIGRTKRDIEFRSPHKDIWLVPTEGDRVEVYEIEKGTYAARYPSRTSDQTMPAGLQEGDIAIQTDSGTSFKITDAGNVDIDASGNVLINADGDVKIDGIDFDQHVHDFEDSTIEDTDDGTGTESTQTKQTAAPQ